MGLLTSRFWWGRPPTEASLKEKPWLMNRSPTGAPTGYGSSGSPGCRTREPRRSCRRGSRPVEASDGPSCQNPVLGASRDGDQPGRVWRPPDPPKPAPSPSRARSQPCVRFLVAHREESGRLGIAARAGGRGSGPGQASGSPYRGWRDCLYTDTALGVSTTGTLFNDPVNQHPQR